MPRGQRLVLPEVPLHFIQRGHNRQSCFVENADYLAYLTMLRDCVRHAKCCLHAYVLMSNHVHLLLTIADVATLARMMKTLGQEYAQAYNRRHHHTGSLWEGRYKSNPVQTESYFLECQRYIELNPVRAGMVGFPGNYRWSSYRCNAEGGSDALITPHSLYQRLGTTRSARLHAYQQLFDESMREKTVEKIRSAIYLQQVL